MFKGKGKSNVDEPQKKPAKQAKLKEMVMQNFYETMDPKYKPKMQTYKDYPSVKIDLPMRMIVVGASGTGKTTTLINIIKHISAWYKIYIFCKKKKEPLYEMLKGDLAKLEKKWGKQIVYQYHSLENLPPADSYDKNEPTLCIFDDMITEKDKHLAKIQEYFILIREYGVSLAFVSQKYVSIPILIRANADYVVLKRINVAKEKDSVMREYDVGSDPKKLVKVYEWVLKTNPLNFFMIDTVTTNNALRFRINYKPLPAQMQKMLYDGAYDDDLKDDVTH